MTAVNKTEPDENRRDKGQAPFLDVADVARELDLSTARIYAMIAEGKLPATKRGRRVRIPRAAFERWLDLEAEIALANLTDEAGK